MQTSIKISICLILICTLPQLLIGKGGKTQKKSAYETSRAIEDQFSEIVLDGVYEIELKKSDRNFVKIRAKTQQIASYVITDVVDGKLTIELKNTTDQNNNVVVNNAKLFIVLQFKELTSLQVEGVIKALLRPFGQESFDINVSGASILSCQDLTVANKLSVDITDTSSVILKSGKAGDLEVSVDGVSSFKAGTFKSDSAVVSLSGVSEAWIGPTKSLQPTLEGVSKLNVVGSRPEIKNPSIDMISQLRYIKKASN